MADVTEWATRRLALVIVATMVLTTAVALPVGVLLGRHSTPGDNHQPLGASTRPASLPPATATVAVVPSPTSAGVDHTAEPAGALPGTPSRVNEFGIPVGYPHTEAGAISACGNYVSAYMTSGNREPTRIRKILNSISVTGAADKIAKSITDTDAATAKNLGVPSINSPEAAFSLRVVGYRAQSFTTTKASIQIWANASVGVYGDAPDVAPRESWGTDICTVTWSGDDWDLSDAGNGPDGPAPTDRASEQFQRFVLQGAPA
ncbi:hypothetical protein [Pseudofrankia sp. BMG5.37]|uniref:hypothetical protein n=1 Tax=Pseudofrankia sp. BMG5.37 TaxID=3050035 RepID=UPI002895DD16|nr:hypothetical protein [Pseudofrankia sp. BMG5.37]MDT3446617.1 hypothetical protein [Pseudofrankia sp. BMG5.37]